MSETILIKGGTIVTMDDRNSIVRGDVLIRDGRMTEIGNNVDAIESEKIDATGCAVLPGFVQTHIHLCQTLFRGAADDLALIDWLKQRVWPMEAAHTRESIRASARLGIAELIRGGTTCALTMETVKHTEEVLRVVDETGFRATVGKCMMDKGEEVPAGLLEKTRDSISESLALIEQWHGSADGRVRCCFAPRFAISCTKELLIEVAELARSHRVMIHTHASENRKECELVEAETGRRNVAYLDSLGISGAHVLLAHCVHLDTEEMETLARTKTNVAHCPSSNLKLGFGAHSRDAGAADSGFTGCGWRRVQQPPRYVYGNAHRSIAAETCSWAGSAAGHAGFAHGDDRRRAQPGTGKGDRQFGGRQARGRDRG